MQLFIFGLVLGAIAGILLILIFNPKKKHQQALIDELTATKAELQTQQEELASHFADSAELLDKMAQDFRNLYQHMAKNSQAILNKKSIPSPTAPEKIELTSENASETVAADEDRDLHTLLEEQTIDLAEPLDAAAKITEPMADAPQSDAHTEDTLQSPSQVTPATSETADDAPLDGPQEEASKSENK